ncbi:protein CUP-SHAPED COTYLEDON 3-like [Olea europaea var. sylvestris]|uniref:protein CUP-SHAPED COTYLEDON 3-like n=1 Tax=Olea europaea var. sylvestris TaxID=158386 RepID=UPI000C1D3D2B|nr:protein CUP-SHAPED COTYLEDON 3-like [Olea europaea var. sylvestris]
MGLRDIGETLPPGFRFYPSDEELVCHYLYKKIANEQVLKGTLVEIDLHTCEPWQLPEVAKLNSSEWYFFSFRDRKYATGYRTNRATTSGYWKATGKDRAVLDPRSRATVGMRKTLVFYKNRAPNGIKTGWIMHEFRLENPHVPPKEDWVLCRVFHKGKSENGNQLSPQNFYNSTTSNMAASPHTNEYTLPNYGDQNAITFSEQGQNPSTFHDLLAPDVDRSNYLQLSQEMNIETPSGCKMMQTKFEDDYGFFFDTSYEESTLMRDFDEENSRVYV